MNLFHSVLSLCIYITYFLSTTVDGAWSEWGAFGECNADCGGGVMARFRQCDNPPASNGGARCPGPSAQKEQCNQQPCKTRRGRLETGGIPGTRTRRRKKF